MDDRGSRVGPPNHARLIAVGGSTGAPPVVKTLLAGLDADAPPVLVTQHMSRGLAPAFVAWLDGRVSVRVELARAGGQLERGHVYVAPDDVHLELGPQFQLSLSTQAPVAHHRPAVDPLFESTARVAGGAAVAVLLTGMGSDGARGLTALRRAGAFTMVQDPQTAAEPSMPSAAIALDAARMVATPQRLSEVLRHLQAFRASRPGPVP